MKILSALTRRMPSVWWPGKTWNSGIKKGKHSWKNEQKATENSVCDAIVPDKNVHLRVCAILAQSFLRLKR